MKFDNAITLCSTAFSTLVAIVVIAVGIYCVGELREQEERDKYVPTHFESPESKLTMVAMRCHALKQEVDMLRGRIEALEESNSITNVEDFVDFVPCMQYYAFLYQSETNKPELVE